MSPLLHRVIDRKSAPRARPEPTGALDEVGDRAVGCRFFPVTSVEVAPCSSGI